MLKKTPHISCDTELLGDTVLMPGDPLRSKFIAETFFESPLLINNIRGVMGYTGKYNNKRISVMASGMGMPSMGIYSYELFNIFDVSNIIRVGTAGGLGDNINLRDVIIASTVVTNSSYVGENTLLHSADSLMNRAIDSAKIHNSSFHVGTICTSDYFYDSNDNLAYWKNKGALAVEMEAAALYLNAKNANKNALCICTVSDCPLKENSITDPSEREKTFLDMIKIALDTAI